MKGNIVLPDMVSEGNLGHRQIITEEFPKNRETGDFFTCAPSYKFDK
jgi:hypothetical protein